MERSTIERQNYVIVQMNFMRIFEDSALSVIILTTLTLIVDCVNHVKRTTFTIFKLMNVNNVQCDNHGLMEQSAVIVLMTLTLTWISNSVFNVQEVAISINPHHNANVKNSFNTLMGINALPVINPTIMIMIWISVNLVKITHFMIKILKHVFNVLKINHCFIKINAINVLVKPIMIKS